MKKCREREQSSSLVHGNGVDEELIRKRAYELCVDRGMEDGHDLACRTVKEEVFGKQQDFIMGFHYKEPQKEGL